MSGTAERKTRVLPVNIRRFVVPHRVIPRRSCQRPWLDGEDCRVPLNAHLRTNGAIMEKAKVPSGAVPVHEGVHSGCGARLLVERLRAAQPAEINLTPFPLCITRLAIIFQAQAGLTDFAELGILKINRISRGRISHGCKHVTVGDWQGSQHRCAPVCVPPPGARPRHCFLCHFMR